MERPELSGAHQLTILANGEHRTGLCRCGWKATRDNVDTLAQMYADHAAADPQPTLFEAAR